MSTSSSARLYSVLPHHVNQVWNDVAPFIAESLKYDDGKWDLADIIGAIERKDMQLFVIKDEHIKSAFVTQINQYPRKKVLSVLFLGGNEMEKWIHLISEIEQWAKDLGCASIEVQGRKGWGKVLGWNNVYSVIRKNIER